MRILKSKWLRRSILWLFLSIFTVITVVFIWVFLQIKALPSVNPQMLNTYAPTQIVAANGQVLWQPTNQHVTPMKADEIPAMYKKTLIAVEDSSFWTNKGYSKKGVVNMVFTAIASKINPNIAARGGSSIEQQLIKNVFFNGGGNMRTTTRKVQEIYLAQQLDHNFSKNQILTFYVNSLEFAEGDKGAASVMMTDFGKKPSDYAKSSTQNIAQQAYIAGLGQNPTAYNLYTNPKLGNARKNVVLGVMLKNKIIDRDEYNEAVSYDLKKDLKPRFWKSKSQYKRNLKYKVYTDGVLNSANQMGYNLNDVSLKINTYLDPKTFDKITNMIRKDKYYQDGGARKEQVGATIINHDGIVEGMVGSRHENDEYNRAMQMNRSSGSSIKPFTAYGPLLQYLGSNYNTTSRFNSSPYRYPGTNLYMRNYGNENAGAVDIKRALRLSLNTVVGRIDDDVLGSTRMKAFLNGVGLDVKSSYSAADGIGLSISTLQAAAAWNAINNGGIYTKPRFIKSIEFPDGSVKKIKPIRHRAMNASTAYVLSQMLRGVLARGYTGYQGSISKYSGYAAKTGTVGLPEGSKAKDVYGSGGTDAWFDSITKDGYAIALWLGYDNPNKSPQVADNNFGYQHLGRDLQLELTGNESSISNWSEPDGVRNLGGDGLDADYEVTDAKDINNVDDTTINKILSGYYNVAKVNGLKIGTKADVNWSDSIPDNETAFYDIYRNDHNILNNTSVINESLFNALLKKKGSDD